jgi:oligopeptide transport system permease protein
LVLPAITLALPFTARIARLMRAGMLDVLNQDFVRTARAKGLRERVVIMRHTLRGGVLPVLSYLGPAIAAAMTGSLVIEKIFQIPGLGREFVEAALNRDYTLVMGTVIVFGVLLIIMNLLVDIAYAMLDPRVEYD